MQTKWLAPAALLVAVAAFLAFAGVEQEPSHEPGGTGSQRYRDATPDATSDATPDAGPVPSPTPDAGATGGSDVGAPLPSPDAGIRADIAEVRPLPPPKGERPNLSPSVNDPFLYLRRPKDPARAQGRVYFSRTKGTLHDWSPRGVCDVDHACDVQPFAIQDLNAPPANDRADKLAYEAAFIQTTDGLRKHDGRVAKPFELDDAQRRPLIALLVAQWCEPCTEEFPYLVDWLRPLAAEGKIRVVWFVHGEGGASLPFFPALFRRRAKARTHRTVTFASWMLFRSDESKGWMLPAIVSGHRNDLPKGYLFDGCGNLHAVFGKFGTETQSPLQARLNKLMPPDYVCVQAPPLGGGPAGPPRRRRPRTFRLPNQ